MEDSANSGRYVLLQTVVPDYRAEVFKQLTTRLGRDFLLMVGDVYFDGTTKTRVNLGVNQRAVHNVFLLGRRLAVQFGQFRRVLSADRAILEMNPRLLTNWPMILLRRLMGKATCVWGHAWPRSGRGGRTFARDLMVRLAGNALAYTSRDAEDFRQRLPGHIKVYCASNALYPAAQIFDRAVDVPFRFVFVGRLVAEKKPELAIRAFAIAAPAMPGCRLTVVGSGPEDESLRSLVAELRITEAVEFLGHVNDLQRLSHLLGESVASLSPGYVGLSAIQSFSFGTPMLIADNEPHSPEIAAVKEGANSLFFTANDPDDFARAMKQMWNDRQHWAQKRPLIADACRENYSVERMAEGFMEFFGAEAK